MVSGPATIPIMQVRGSSAIIYDEYLFSSKYGKNRLRRNMKNNRRTRYSGKMTDGCRKRLARAATLMSQACKSRWITNPVTGRLQLHKFSFITLTVSCPRNITAKEGYKLLLADFLQWMRRSKGVTTYIWKAELQKRGQLHYHITTPSFIHYREIRDKWNDLQLRAGLLKEFADHNGHTDPNSTDVHEVRQVRDMARYLVKELAKSMQNETATQGKIWDCSDNLAGVSYFAVPLSGTHEKRLTKLIDAGRVRMFGGDRWTIIEFTDTGPPNLLEKHERDAMDKYLDEILNGKPEPEELPFIDIPAAPAVDPVSEWKPIIQQTLF